ncbi:protein ACCELERATED CELL DEATH 6-like [Magnolia sinica]|uniref:protein ACCELERATED CELL DEATH 6-like n=1 Tax=Magnolia sinica TaxID=86752 RepID=UPI00265AC64B|nr:protein ACCELERATED CELL DEATH 6-like [Magnolia sinica]XP_058092375.1 protein ACCELERATED CELL DEATH 6-like [Magnolia sinica]
MDPQLHEAARRGSVPLLKAIKDEDQQILHSTAPQMNNALHIAARLGHAEFTKEILGRCGAHLMQVNSAGDTPLHCAARTGRLNVVEILLNWIETEDRSLGLLRITNKEKNTALHEALRNRHGRVAMKLLESDWKLACLVNEAGESPLHIAAREELLQVVQMILDTTPSADELMPLQEVVNRIHADLWEQKRDIVRIQDNHGRTALHYAACQDKPTIVSVLLRSDHSLAYILDNNGCSPLHIAAASGSPLVIAELLKHCPDVSEQLDPSGKNVFHIAIIYRKYSTVRRLLRMPELEGMINEPDADGNTLLHLAAKYRSDALLMLLSRDRRMDMTIMNKDGQTALDLIEMDPENHEIQLLILKYLRYHGAIRGRRQQMPSGIHETRPQNIDMADWNERYKARVSTYTLVAALIATVTFAAAFTMPGGYRNDDPNQGAAVLVKRWSFKAFLFSNTIALCCSLMVVVCFIWAWGHHMSFLRDMLMWGHRLTIIACLALMVSFMAAVYAVVAPECLWLAILILAMGCSGPFLVYCLIGHTIWYIPF